MSKRQNNLDAQVVQDFGSEWGRFDQSILSENDLWGMFEDFFRIFPWNALPTGAIGADIGCGSGRWAALVAPKVGQLHLVEPSWEAIEVAKRNLSRSNNTTFHQLSVGNLPFEKDSLDFAYSLGVLHHVPDTYSAIKSISRVLRPGAPFLVYLYYAFDQRPRWFRLLWKCSDLFRKVISSLPPHPKKLVCDIIAALVYLPLARTAQLLDRFNSLPNSFPLSWYRDRDFYVLRTDALDRFGTRLEKRFLRSEIHEMLEAADFCDIRFSESQPFWCAVGIKKKNGASTVAHIQ
jgi:SAM-dependent methyltransferase